MSRTLPLSYVRPVTGKVAPGEFLTCAGGRGDVGQWVTDPSAELIDPSANNTEATLAAKHNELVWLYGLTRILTVQPRMYFGSAGVDGIQFFKDNNPVGRFSTYSVPPYVSLTMSDFLETLNAVLGDTSKVEAVYDGKRINMIFKSSSGTWQFCEPFNYSYGSAKRMLNRIFNRTDAELTLMGTNSFTGPVLVQGSAPFSNPVVGVYPVPAAVTNLTSGNRTLTSFDVTWTASTSSDVTEYYLKISADTDTYIKVPASQTSKTITTAEGFDVNKLYTITVVASTPFEISESSLPTENFIGTDIPQLTVTTSVTTSSITVSWTPIAGDYDVNFSSPQPDLGLSMASGSYTFIGLDQNTTYPVTVYLSKFGIEGPVNTVNVKTSPIITVEFNVRAVSANATFMYPTITPTFTPRKVMDMPAAQWPANLTDTRQIIGVRYNAYADRSTGGFIAAAEFLLQGKNGLRTMFFSYDNTLQRKYTQPTTFLGIGTCAQLGTDPNWSQPPWVTNAVSAPFTITNPTTIRDFFGTETQQGISTTIDKTRGIQAYWMISYPGWSISNCECTEFVIIYNPA